MTQNYVKDPDAILDYTINWLSWLGSDTISTSEWFVDAIDVTKESDSKTTTTTTVWLSGGIVGNDYTVTNRIITSGGRTDDRSIFIVVNER